MILFGGAGLDGDDRSINLCDLHKLDTAPDEIARDCTRVHESARARHDTPPPSVLGSSPPPVHS